jgi:Ni,Fe-hydrogenase III component G
MMQPDIQTLHSRITSQYDSASEINTEIKNDMTLVISREYLKDVIEMINDYFSGVHLSTITAQKRKKQDDKVELIYHFYQGFGFSLLVSLSAKEPQVNSIVSIIPGSDFYEREIAEMFGVEFIDRTETRRLLLPDDWDQGPPFMKKDNDE